MELPTADVTSTEMDSLQQSIYDKDEEIRQLTRLLATKEAEEEERRSGSEKELEDELRGEISDLKAQLTEEEDQKMKAEEELKNLQSRVIEMEHKEVVVKLEARWHVWEKEIHCMLYLMTDIHVNHCYNAHQP